MLNFDVVMPDVMVKNAYPPLQSVLKGTIKVSFETMMFVSTFLSFCERNDVMEKLICCLNIVDIRSIGELRHQLCNWVCSGLAKTLLSFGEGFPSKKSFSLPKYFDEHEFIRITVCHIAGLSSRMHIPEQNLSLRVDPCWALSGLPIYKDEISTMTHDDLAFEEEVNIKFSVLNKSSYGAIAEMNIRKSLIDSNYDCSVSVAGSNMPVASHSTVLSCLENVLQKEFMMMKERCKLDCSSCSSPDILDFQTLPVLLHSSLCGCLRVASALLNFILNLSETEGYEAVLSEETISSVSALVWLAVQSGSSFKGQREVLYIVSEAKSCLVLLSKLRISEDYQSLLNERNKTLGNAMAMLERVLASHFERRIECLTKPSCSFGRNSSWGDADDEFEVAKGFDDFDEAPTNSGKLKTMWSFR